MQRLLFAQSQKSVFAGSLLVEVVLVIALLGIICTALAGAFITGAQGGRFVGENNRAQLLVQEGLEVVSFLHHQSPGTPPQPGKYGIEYTDNGWQLIPQFDTRDIYNRQIEVVNDGLFTDYMVSVSWERSPLVYRSVMGSVRLSQWLLPVVPPESWKLSGVLDLPGPADAVDISISGSIGAVLRTSASEFNFVALDTLNPQAPVARGSLVVPGPLVGVAVHDQYAFVISKSDEAEIQVVDMSDPDTLSIVDTIDLPGGFDPTQILISGEYLYISRTVSVHSELYIASIIDPLNIEVVGSVNITGEARSISKHGEYIYYVTELNSRELSIVHVADPNNPNIIRVVNLPNDPNPSISSTNNNLLLIGRHDGVTTAQLSLFSLSNPTSPVSVGSATIVPDSVRVFDSIIIPNSTDVLVLTNSINAELQVYSTKSGVLALLKSIDLGGGFIRASRILYDTNSKNIYLATDANQSEIMFFEKTPD